MAKQEKIPTTPNAESMLMIVPAAQIDAVATALAAPFEGVEVKFKPQVVSGNRALVVPFVDARVIQDRLDDVLGVMGWQDSYECLPDGSVVCRLRIRLGTEWITKEDVGGQSEQPDEGDRRKAAFSDALKRAAVKFGVGRYLYRLKPQWVDYDPQKRQLIGTPRLPVGAVASAPPVVSTAVVETPAGTEAVPVTEKKGGKGKTAGAAAAPPANRSKPASGLELKRRLAEKDAVLAREGLCKPGELLHHIINAGVKAGHGEDLTAWTEAAIDVAIGETRAFEAAHRPQPRQVA